MRKLSLLLILAVAWFAVVPEASEARGRRRCCPGPCAWYCYPPPPCGTVYLPPSRLPKGVSAPKAARRTPVRTVTIKGRTYQLFDTRDRSNYPEGKVRDVAALLDRVPQIPGGDVFRGTARRVAKTIIPQLQSRTFDSISALRDWVPSNEAMQDLQIGTGPDVDRVQEEK
jgi:hypothetical protein